MRATAVRWCSGVYWLTLYGRPVGPILRSQERNSIMFKRATLSVSVVVLVLNLLPALVIGAAAARAAEPVLKSDRGKLSVVSGDVFVLQVTGAAGTDLLLRVFDEKGNWLRSLAGRRLDKTSLVVPWNMKDNAKRFVQLGKYTIRLEAGWNLKLDETVAAQGVLSGPPFVSPRDLAVDTAGAT